MNGASANFTFDDFYILDDTGSDNNDFLGSRKIVTISPSADAETDFTPSTGADNAALVADNPADDDGSYVESSTSGHKDLYAYGDIAGLGAINAVQVITIVRETDANPFTLKTLVKSGETESADAGQVIGSQTYKGISRVLEVNPDTSAAWTPAEINAAQFGMEVG